MRYVLTVLFLAVCVPAQGQWAPKHDASWWNQQTDAYKLGYITGYEAAHISIGATCRAEKVSSIEVCSRLAPLFVLGLDEKDVLARLESFYKDSRNKDVILELAIIQVGKDIDAKVRSDNDHAEAVDRMREVSKPK